MAERIRGAIGIGIPLAMLVFFGAILVHSIAVGNGNTVLTIQYAAITWGVLAGPFLMYYVGIRTLPLTVLVGAFLIGLSVWAIRLVLTDTNSTAGVNVLWIPYFGYPVTAVSVGVDYGVRKLREEWASAAR